jgi:hypothetical protein
LASPDTMSGSKSPMLSPSSRVIILGHLFGRFVGHTENRYLSIYNGT